MSPPKDNELSEEKVLEEPQEIQDSPEENKVEFVRADSMPEKNEEEE